MADDPAAAGGTPPALTAEEWAHFGDRQAVMGRGYDDGRTLLELFGGAGGAVAVWDLQVRGAQPALIGEPATKRAAVALLNAALPDDDPGKLTRETLEVIRRAADAFEYPDRYESLTPEDRVVLWTDLGRVVDQLAALLPPREEGR